MYQLPMLDHVERLSVLTKCETCSRTGENIPLSELNKKPKPVITENQFLVVTPFNEDMDPMEALKLSKRLVCCTVCGTLRLIN